MQKLFSSKAVIVLCIAICFIVTTNIHWGKNKWQNIIEADAKGYYAYLPAVFIYHDLNFNFYDSIEKKKYYNDFLVYDYRATAPDGRRIDKYYCGTAVAQLPFFLIAHVLAKISGADADGYSRPYMLSITLAALFYLFIGLWFINKLLELYTIGNRARSLTMIALLFGTNLFFYSVCEMGMSHVYSFALVAMFCFYIKKYSIGFSPKTLIISLALLGMIFLIRPVNVLILLAVPFLSGSRERFTAMFKNAFRQIKALITGIAVLLVLIGIQCVIYKISTGQWWIYSYGDERFDFAHPHFIGILFSYKKGLFLYTPLYLLSLAGLYALYKKNKFESGTFLLFFIVITYVLSSWWNWWYGGSFSSRVYVEFLSLFAVLMGLFLQNTRNKIARIATTVGIILLIALCQVQTYQYRYYIIHWEDMNKEKYWNVFLKLDKKDVGS